MFIFRLGKYIFYFAYISRIFLILCGFQEFAAKVVICSHANDGISCFNCNINAFFFKTKCEEFDKVILYSLEESNFDSKKFYDSFINVKILKIQAQLQGINSVSKFLTNSKKLTIFTADNCEIASLADNYFQHAPNLNSLFLRRNLIGVIYDKAFSKLKKLQNLYLEQNLINELSNRVFDELILLENLFLGHNQINTLPKNLFEKNTKLINADFSHNSIFKLDDSFKQQYPQLNLILSQNFTNDVCVEKNISNETFIDYYESEKLKLNLKLNQTESKQTICNKNLTEVKKPFNDEYGRQDCNLGQRLISIMVGFFIGILLTLIFVCVIYVVIRKQTKNTSRKENIPMTLLTKSHLKTPVQTILQATSKPKIKPKPTPTQNKNVSIQSSKTEDQLYSEVVKPKRNSTKRKSNSGSINKDSPAQTTLKDDANSLIYSTLDLPAVQAQVQVQGIDEKTIYAEVNHFKH